MIRSSIFFDDVCVLCNRTAAFILKNDPSGKFLFASTGSEDYLNLLKNLNIDPGSLPDSIVLFHREKIYTRSTAVLRVAANLRFPWPIFSVFFIVPRFIRDTVYNFVARKRYRWFGKRESCFVPGDMLYKTNYPIGKS